MDNTRLAELLFEVLKDEKLHARAVGAGSNYVDSIGANLTEVCIDGWFDLKAMAGRLLERMAEQK
jgi:hypothetical protein